MGTRQYQHQSPKWKEIEQFCVPVKDGITEWPVQASPTEKLVPYYIRERRRLRICPKADVGDRATDTEGDYFSSVLTLLDLRRHERATFRLSLLGSATVAAGLSQVH